MSPGARLSTTATSASRRWRTWWPALGYLIDLGIADPERCAIEGWSWGGYIAMLAIGLHPTTFVAAIGGIPVCDSVMTHEDCSPSQQAYDRAIMGGGRQRRCPSGTPSAHHRPTSMPCVALF